MPQKTPEYTRRAVQKYRENKDQINLVLDKGTKERIETLTGKKASAYIRALVMGDLQRLEAGNGPQEPEPTQESTQKQETPGAVTWEDLQEIQKRAAEQARKEREQAEIDRYTAKMRFPWQRVRPPLRSRPQALRFLCNIYKCKGVYSFTP